MFEKNKISQSEAVKSVLCASSNDAPNLSMTGHITDRIYNKNGDLIDVIEGHNLVVNSFLNLVMCLIKNQDGYSGIKYWAIGSGSSDWGSTPPTPDSNATRLTNEIYRIAISPNEIKFLDSNFNEVSTPTNIIQISHTFGLEECNGEWREFGIFGGNATQTANSGIMINKRHHAVLTKTEEMSIERVMRFTLNLG